LLPEEVVLGQVNATDERMVSSSRGFFVLMKCGFPEEAAMYNRLWGSDRRRFSRLSVNLTVLFRVDSPLHVRNMVGDREIEAATVDLSSGGMSFLTEYNIPVWTTLSLKFKLFKLSSSGMFSFHAPVQVFAEVRSSVLLESGRYRLGLCFTEVRQEDKARIASFVEDTY